MAQNINPDHSQSVNSSKQNSDIAMAKDNHAVTKRLVQFFVVKSVKLQC